MPYYVPLKTLTPIKTRKRTVAGLKRLRAQLDAEMPRKTRDSSLILGTWNIRNFDDNRFNSGPRSTEDFYYMAEIISRFDVIAVQEICDDLRPLENLMRILGQEYDYILTDTTEGSGGNDERLGFIFQKEKVRFKNIAGEIVLPVKNLISDVGKKRQFARTPFMCSFQAKWFRFNFATVHIYFGKDTGEKYARRVAEIDAVAKAIARKAKKDSCNHILVGDFNIKKSGSAGYNALEKGGFTIVQNKVGSNKDQTKFYDQISFLVRKDKLLFSESDRSQGVLQFFNSVYREEDFLEFKTDLLAAVELKIKKLAEESIPEKKRLHDKTQSANQKAKYAKSLKSMKASLTDWKKHRTSDIKLKKYYLSDWRTFHGSDHLPLWVELEIDFSNDYLQQLAEQ